MVRQSTAMILMLTEIRLEVLSSTAWVYKLAHKIIASTGLLDNLSKILPAWFRHISSIVSLCRT